ncbi:MAG: cobalt transporter CbiM [Deltaproteobacteria bacterium]|nr:cobalt transporter CbiM [Deltaproteobacteria bacterium]
MHIPDGYLGPKTCALFYIFMFPVWSASVRRVEKEVSARGTALFAFAASFAFVIMMFNFPVPGGTSGHIVGSALLAITLGPWYGCMAATLALFLQAVLFADGGITAFGANSFNMAFLMSFSGYYLYRLFAAGAPGNRRRFAAAFAAAYIAVNIAALAAAIELGVQPAIEHDVMGRPLYSPYPMAVSIPAMMVPHLLFFGPVEGIGTALIAGWLARAPARPAGWNVVLPATTRAGRAPLRALWVLLFITIILTPLGLIGLKGTPWGEWGKEEFSRVVGRGATCQRACHG